MDQQTSTLLRVGDWCVNQTTGQISRPGEIVTLEARTMRLLLCLAENPGAVVSIEDLLNRVWSGVIVTQDSVYQAVASLRRQLKDDAKEPAYIANVPRLGYRMVATVGPWEAQPLEPLARASADASAPFARNPSVRAVAALALTAVLCLLVLFVIILNHRKIDGESGAAARTAVPRKSVAVLPFLDLTSQSMDQEYFADGMTEELIDKLSKIPGFRVPAPTSSFYFKGTKATIAEIAKSLGVAFVLDGSIRKSDTTFRVAARLVRAQDGFVVWTETYDRPLGDQLAVQESIANDIANALRTSID